MFYSCGGDVVAERTGQSSSGSGRYTSDAVDHGGVGTVPKGATRARAREDVDKGVERCIELMTGGKWVTGRSHRAIAEEFGVSPATVKDWATSASRVIRLAIQGDADDIRSRMVATLESIVAASLDKVVTDREGDVFPSPDGRVAVAAISEQAKLLGLHAPTKVDVTVQAFAQLEPPAMLAKVRAQIAELQRLEQQLSEQVEAIPALPVGDDE